MGVWPIYTQEDLENEPLWTLDMIPGSVWFTFGGRDRLREELYGPPPWMHQPGVPDLEKVGAYAVMLEDVRRTGPDG